MNEKHALSHEKADAAFSCNSGVPSGHVLSYSLLVMIWFALTALTGVTVTAAGLHLGNASALAAILIAATKGTLVLFYFMNLRNEEMMFKLMLLVALATLTVIMLLTFVDLGFRREENPGQKNDLGSRQDQSLQLIRQGDALKTASERF